MTGIGRLHVRDGRNDALAFVLRIAALCVGSVLLWAAIHKLGSPHATFASLAWAFSDRFAGVLLVALVSLELWLGVSLLLPPTRRWLMGGAAMLFASFAMWMGLQHVLDAPVPCGCGFSSQTSAQSVSHERAMGISRALVLAVASGGACLLASVETRKCGEEQGK